MRRKTILLASVVWLALSLQGVAAVATAPQAQRPIELADILAWKSIGTSDVSNDGRWVAYRVSPNDGDSDVVIRSVGSDKEYRFQVGEGTGGSLVFSDDSRWVAFTIAPSKKEAERLKKQQKPLRNKARVLNTGTGDEVEFENVKRFAFSGEGSKWLAIHKEVPEAQAKDRDRPKGTDLVLRELSTGAELNIGNVAEFAFDKAGLWLAWIVDAHDKSGNGVQLRELSTGVVKPLESGKAVYERITWTEQGDAITVLKGMEDKAFKDKLYSVVGFTGIAGAPQKIVFDPAEDSSFPNGMTVSPNRAATWTEDRAGILFGIHAVAKADKPAEKPGEADEAKQGDAPKPDEASAEKPDLVLWHWLDKRLQSQQKVEEERDRRFSYLAIYRVADRKFVRLADDAMRDVRLPVLPARWAVGVDDSGYARAGSMDGQRYQDVYVVDLQTGERRLAVKRARWLYAPSPDGAHLLYYDDGHYFVHGAASGQTVNVTKGVPTSFVNADDDHNVTKPPVPPVGWAKDGATVLLSDSWDIWSVPAAGGPGKNLTVTGRKEATRYRRRFALNPDEKGIDLSAPMYFEAYGEWTKKKGIAVVEGGSPGARRLLWDDATFSRLMKPKKAGMLFYTRETHAEPAEIHAADMTLAGGTKLSDLKAQQADFLWSAGATLVNYTSAKGDKLQAALFLPANYEKGKSYPTIVYIYERLTDGLNRFYTPSANGFNKSVYTSNGYAVLMPDITYKLNDPGMSAVWCVLPALKAAVATGVVDEKRVGIHGHSWGGYQTAFLVTQTNAFKAAVAGAPLTNMVSMYSLLYKNTGGTNQAIFESSQGRFLGSYIDNWEAYVRNSPVNFAKNVKTPLIILHNDQDGAVDFTQGVEYFNTLRRMGKEVIMLEYVGENHGLRKPANQRDYTVRMREFFDHHLLDKPAPGWMTEGVQRLQMEDHLKIRSGGTAAVKKITS
jgi:dipeptidyl aminopeptidase/acylaminoacyl peptidase